MEKEQNSALTDLLNFCRRSIRKQHVDVNEWQQLRSRMNKAFVTSGPPRIKAGYGLISDLMKGVPVEVVRKRYKVSRGTVYRMIKEHPELAKKWEEKKKKKNPDLVPDPTVDPSPARPTTPPLPDVLLQFLASHEPEMASTKKPVGLHRVALGCLMSNLGLVREAEFDAMTNEELVARVTVYQSNCEDHPEETRMDAVEPPSPLLPSPDLPTSGIKRFQVSVRGVDELENIDDAAKLLADEIANNLEPFTDMDVLHPLFTELKLHVRVDLAMRLAKGRTSVSDDDIPEIARSAVKRVKDKSILPQEVLEFAGLVSVAEPPIKPPGDSIEGEMPDDTARTATSPQSVLDEFLARH